MLAPGALVELALARELEVLGVTDHDSTGGLAPAMMQQSFGLRSAVTKQICEANPWPYPTGVAGAPGAEQADTSKNDEYTLGD